KQEEEGRRPCKRVSPAELHVAALTTAPGKDSPAQTAAGARDAPGRRARDARHEGSATRDEGCDTRGTKAATRAGRRPRDARDEGFAKAPTESISSARRSFPPPRCGLPGRPIPTYAFPRDALER